MANDFRSAYTKLRLVEPIAYSPEALTWLRMVIHRASDKLNGHAELSPEQLQHFMVKQAQIDFGNMAAEVMNHWGIIDGETLSQSLAVLNKLGAVLLSSENELDSYRSLSKFQFD